MNSTAQKRAVLTAQDEVDDLYVELERRFGDGFAWDILRRYTDLTPSHRDERCRKS